MMQSEGRTRSRDAHEERREGLLHRIEEKLNRLLGQEDDDWHDRRWAPEDAPFARYSPGDASPRLFGGPRADAPGWDPSLAGPRFDRIDVGSVGTHGVDPRSSYDGSQTPAFSPHSSAREYFLLMEAEEEAHRGHGDYAGYRTRTMREFDRDYAEYRRDQQDRFDREFHAWRESRKGPAQEPLRTEAKADESGVRPALSPFE